MSHPDPSVREWAVDERLVAGEGRYEIIDGRVIHTAPAHEPHGRRHAKIAGLVEAHAAADYTVAADMLTRTQEFDDFAPDVSIYPHARDPDSGGRQLEEMVFEVVSKETLGHAGKKAAKLCARGVRRVFGVDIERERLLEWSRATDAWEILGPDFVLFDPTLAAPLPGAALLTAAASDDLVAEALLAKKNAVLARTIDKAAQTGADRGRAEERAESILDFLAFRGLSISEPLAARIRETSDLDLLAEWKRRVTTVASAEALFDA